ncbi:molybdopterin molybdotransferase MoeA [Hamadaea tsunoensis]|uniref:molybdopterin molybdotransferase MoeA n=1 Tax=Hamadaea tsunoensis TaxID=53368 RepID=UPI00040A558A|nr:molybdopterin molybdotransferase MoeA [Hamadaea tsunoensis]
MSTPIAWSDARTAVYRRALAQARMKAAEVALSDADGLTLAEPLVARTPLPAFPTASVDGWVVRGTGPWRVVDRVLAGHRAPDLTEDGTAMEIATGAMVPAGATTILRLEHGDLRGDEVAGSPKTEPEWRLPGDECAAGEELLPAGTPISPGVLGLAASCGYDTLLTRHAPRATTVVFGDELLDSGLPGDGRVRDALGPSIPAFLRRLGARTDGFRRVQDTLAAHVDALRQAVAGGSELICTTGGTMHGPVDYLHPALAELGASYVVNTVAVRPGFPMLVAELPGGQFVAGLPGNPQSAMVALVSLVMPLLAGLRGRPFPASEQVTVGATIADRGDYTHLSLVRRDERDGLVYPVGHVGSAMLRGLAQSTGFAVVPPGKAAHPGDRVDLLELP